MVEIKTSYEDEERFINIGKITAKMYAVVTTYRKKDIRIISARRARIKEIEIYVHIGVSRQAIIKTWLADKIMQIEHHKVAV